MASSAIISATNFLSPVFDNAQLQSERQKSLITRLASNLPKRKCKGAISARAAVIERALELLKNVHGEFSKPAEAGVLQLENANTLKTINALLDLVVLEGIYPSLSPGVGLPLERRARGFTATKPQSGETRAENLSVLRRIVGCFLGIVGLPQKGLRKNASADAKPAEPTSLAEKVICEKYLVDLFAGCGELAFCPSLPEAGQAEWKEMFESLVDATPMPRLLRQLRPLGHRGAPAWFGKEVNSRLSLLPASRPDGVRHVIDMTISELADKGLTLNADHLAALARLIRTPPSSMKPKDYLENICAQLLEILHSEDADVAKVAAFTIAELLGRSAKSVAALVHKELDEKIIGPLNPTTPSESGDANRPAVSTAEQEPNVSSALLELEELSSSMQASRSPLIEEISAISIEEKPLVSEEDLAAALRDISIILASQPGPVIAQKLVIPILSSLWYLLCYSAQANRQSLYEQVLSIIRSAITTLQDDQLLNTLASRELLLFDGRLDGWEFAPGPSGGIEVRKTTGATKSFQLDLVTERISQLMTVMEDEAMRAEFLSDLFLTLFRQWIVAGEAAVEANPVGTLLTVEALQRMLEKFGGNTLGKRPAEIIQIVKEALAGFVEQLKGSAREQQQPAIPAPATLQGLRNIVRSENLQLDGGGSDEDDFHGIEAVTMSMALIEIILSDTAALEPDVKKMLSTLEPSLEYVADSIAVSADIRAQSISLLSQISASPSSTVSSYARDKQTYIQALAFIQDPLVPVRAQGLEQLRTLINARSPVLDIPRLVSTLVDMLAESDSFVYINVIKTLNALADTHGKTVTNSLVEAYRDDDRKLGLDSRLRLGEALVGNVQRLGKALLGEVAETITRGMLEMVSRRRKRDTENEEDEIDEDESSDEEQNEASTPEQRKQRIAIVSGWKNAGSEDLRIRASALSVLTTAIETNALGLAPSVLVEAMDTSLSIISLETSTGAGILRRSAVLCIGGVIHAVVGADEGDHMWRSGIWAILKEKMQDVYRVLRWAVDSDNDGLVREQAKVVVQNLEAVSERSLVGDK